MSTNDPETRRIDMYLNLVERDSARRIVCRECSTDICDAAEDWRDHVAVREREISGRLDEFGVWVKHRDADEEILLIEHYCPECAVQLRAQVTVEGENRPLEVKPDFL